MTKNYPKDISHFLCQYADLSERLELIDPVEYDRTRNYLDGGVTWLSPFITHGIINTRDVADAVLKSHSSKDCYRLLYELAWREYFHRVWEANGDKIFSDMRNPSQSKRAEIPAAVVGATTGIHVIDEAVQNLNTHGFMHNHARMWVAAMCCNMGDTHWMPAAKWMHYHLLDGDLASNTLSWQWVAGTFSHKRYIANQDNVNKYSKYKQHGTFIDVPYETLAQFNVPDELASTISPELPQTLPGTRVADVASFEGTVALRSVWQLDAQWRSDADHHVLFIDEALLAQWPMSQNRWRFILHWANCIPDINIVHGTIEQLRAKLANATVFRESYTACESWDYIATDARQWLYPKPEKPYKSFSQFWKQVQGNSAK